MRGPSEGHYPSGYKAELVLFVLASLLISGSLSQREPLPGKLPCFQNTQPPLEPLECKVDSRYRTISGRCNNLQNPEWGSSGSTFARLLPPSYEDGISSPRGGHHNSRLPNPRWISQKNHQDLDVPDPRYTHMVMQFGQFLDHDLTLTPKDERLNCCNSGIQSNDCFPITIPTDDRFYSSKNTSAKCLNLVRSQPICGERVRQQYNVLTAYVDASQVYGSNLERAAVLRTYADGRLQRNSNNNQLPTMEQLNLRPDTTLLRPQRTDDFVAGEDRVNEHPFLTVMHIIFMREHNRIAKLLKEFLPPNLQTDEVLYQEARRLVIGEMQNIVYGEFLPTLLGVEYMQKYDLLIKEDTVYDPLVNPNIFHSFSTAAFRFGHSMINGLFRLVSPNQNARFPENGSPETPNAKEVFWMWRLREIFQGQSIRGAELPLENMVEGLITQEPQACDAHFTTEITDHLFQKNDRQEGFGEDLLSLNIQRGREHGLQPYNEYRKFCGLPPLTSWAQRPAQYNAEYWDKLRHAYRTVDDIDLFVGGIAEATVKGGAIGPTFACLIGEQFNRIKRGDRFFYTHTNGNGLSKVAKEQVLQRTMADILCDVTSLSKVQKWATLQPNSNYNAYRTCGSGTRQLDIRAVASEIAGELSNLADTNGQSEQVNGFLPSEPRFPQRGQSGRSLRNRVNNHLQGAPLTGDLRSKETVPQEDGNGGVVKFKGEDAIFQTTTPDSKTFPQGRSIEAAHREQINNFIREQTEEQFTSFDDVVFARGNPAPNHLFSASNPRPIPFPNPQLCLFRLC